MFEWMGARTEVAPPPPQRDRAHVFFFRGCLVGAVLGACGWSCCLVSVLRAFAGP